MRYIVKKSYDRYSAYRKILFTSKNCKQTADLKCKQKASQIGKNVHLRKKDHSKTWY